MEKQMFKHYLLMFCMEKHKKREAKPRFTQGYCMEKYKKTRYTYLHHKNDQHLTQHIWEILQGEKNDGQ